MHIQRIFKEYVCELCQVKITLILILFLFFPLFFITTDQGHEFYNSHFIEQYQIPIETNTFPTEFYNYRYQ